MPWCWKENDICAASFATMILFGNLKEFDQYFDIRRDAKYEKLLENSERTYRAVYIGAPLERNELD